MPLSAEGSASAGNGRELLEMLGRWPLARALLGLSVVEQCAGGAELSVTAPTAAGGARPARCGEAVSDFRDLADTAASAVGVARAAVAHTL